ncbi:NucA/NucB deoxyribonuclease domain-containing protein [Actinomadura sp. NEAU-AAG7]|uniref:NucA/NucB deoxyribonuclease domain-containing protein n=1 Tax=Actinomadura sp. NEAU-AAG7 TaxID=2839640 RepID=UPI001BE44CC9|nr:hypothetical protein [Actinomadura sp. NEAU-AAG7]MBT2212427.1 hypothetical protein [Actinomadura sp. NEAU-AAG7]
MFKKGFWAAVVGLVMCLVSLPAVALADAQPTTGPQKPLVPSASKRWESPQHGARVKVRDTCRDLDKGLTKRDSKRRYLTCVRPLAKFPGPQDFRYGVASNSSYPPQQCADEPQDQWHFVSRTEACAVIPMQEEIRNSNNEKIAQLTFRVIQYWYAATTADGRALGNWTYRLDVEKSLLGNEGDVDGATVEASAQYCEEVGIKPGCPVVGTSNYVDFPNGKKFPQQDLIYGIGAYGDWNTDTSIHGKSGDVSWATIIAKIQILFPKMPDKFIHIPIVTEPDIRCDGIDGSFLEAGCVFPQAPDVMEYALDGPYQELALHIFDAQRVRGIPGMTAGGPAPGAPGGTPLTRGTDDNNDRDVACPDRLPRPFGDSCDEYPFNSSGEGASQGNGFSCRMINQDHNSEGGTALSLFYRNHHVLKIDPTQKGDEFFVKITGKLTGASPRAWSPNEERTCSYPDLYIPKPKPLTGLDLSSGNRIPTEGGGSSGLAGDWAKAGYLEGGPLPASGDFNGASNCSISSASMEAQYGVKPNDSADDTAGIQRAIDAIKANCSPTAGYHKLSQITLPAGTLNVTHQIYLDADYLVVRGEGADPRSGTRIVYKPDSNTRYDALTADGADWNEDGMTVDRGDGSSEPAPGGWLWPGRGLFRVQTRDVHPDYKNGWNAAPSNRKDILEGTVNVHWKVGAKLKEGRVKGFAARLGDTSIILADSTNSKVMAGFKVGGYVNIRAANTKKFYAEEMATLPTEHPLQNLHMRQQIFKVTSVEGKTITLDKPLEYDVPVNGTSDGSDPIGTDKPIDSKASPIVDPVLGVGIENLYFTQDLPGEEPASAAHNYGNMDPAGEMHGIVLKWAINCWIKGVQSYMTGSHPIVTEEAKNLSVINNQLDGAWNKGKGGNGYFRGSRVWDSLYAGNATRNLRHFTFQWSASGNVAIGNDFDSDLNLHGGWERLNLFELNRVTVPYGHRSASCYSNCGEEGGGGIDDSQWFPIWWAAGKKAVKWSGSSGYNNVFYNNIMKKQLDSSIDPFNGYFTDRTQVIRFGYNPDSIYGPSFWYHLRNSQDEPIPDWAGHEQDPYCAGAGRRGLSCNEAAPGTSMFLKNVPEFK